ncbi:c-type cytochrome [uncultured Paludibaculum sp.]|uniref:c-type cytochrome n=1 Tax=uncultured Paludibaculum sp. TaxID=1765020 RepID=UPI002AAC3E36|nr:c-type cytochrome [uncultured Paludibaculum sp.]
MKRIMLALIVTGTAAQAAVLVGDSARGAALFKSQNCETCHSVNGEGGKMAPDLGKRSSRGYSPADLSALMWNHAPQMWSAMEKASIAKPKLDSQQAADLFAYFFAARYFEKQGDAGRGRHLFVSKGCSDCHNITSTNGLGGTPVQKWDAVTDPIELARQMWNHSPKMRETMTAKGMKLPELTSVEMNDIAVYLQNLPQTRNRKPEFAPASPTTGEELFQAKGCIGCHVGDNSLAKKTSLRTASEFAASMWNHSSKMKQQSELRPEEMRRLVGYIWSLQFANDNGTAARGQKVFEARGCGNCHDQGSAPKLHLGDRANSYEMISVLWAHGPTMQKEMTSKGIKWPRFENTDMSDLLAFLKTR